jgi:dienelactone hydrolase
LPVVFGAVAALAAAWSPVLAMAQDSLPLPAGLVERAVTVGPLNLPGTITLPVGGSDLPGVVLVHGSGGHDRDETIGPNKPFRDLAWGLAARGIAVLRYDKRSMVAPFSFLGHAFTVKEEVLDDAAAGVALLRSTPGVDPSRVAVLGHSLGATLAPRVARAAPGTAGIILMSGATAPLTDLIIRQVRYLVANAGSDSVQAVRQQTAMEKLVARIQALTPADSLSTVPLLGAPASYWLDLRRVDPVAVADSLNLPMLVLHGARDYQVTPEEASGWKKVLGGKANVTFHEYPDLNHLFIAGSGPSTPAEYAVPGHVSEPVIDDIGAWLKALSGPSAPRP